MDQKKAAKEFYESWKDRGYEKGETQPFWLGLLRDVYGVAKPENLIVFEDKVQMEKTTGFIDARIPATQVLIEQKSRGKSLTKAIKQSDGSMMTPIQQAKKYIVEMAHDEHPRWVVTCNFEEFYIYDMNKPHDDPAKVKLRDLPKEYYRLQFLVDTGKEPGDGGEVDVSVAAGRIVGKLYDAFLGQYKDPTNPASLHSLNVLCVRLVFCLYAEDSGVFPKRAQFHDYLASYSTGQMRKALVDLFHVLDQREDEREDYLEDALAEFPYVNGGLFKDDKVEIPLFTEEIRQLILKEASENFDWSTISPTIFGAVFESTLNPETRRSGGMHYTSVENIHKVLDPLFLNDLEEELQKDLEKKIAGGARTKALQGFQRKLAGLTFLDPACGSGNFLTETYLCLRRMENQVIKVLMSELVGQVSIGDMISDEELGIRVSIGQFSGIEINDFAVSVARTALWIAEHQMLLETQGILERQLEFLPLKTDAKIVEGDALRMEWSEVVPKDKLNYIVGNPPFVGYSLQSKEQKDDLLSVCVDRFGNPLKRAGKIDFCAGWYFKAARMMQGTEIRTALVSTNSITQGEQVQTIWEPLMKGIGVHIDFAYRTFRWDSEANIKAHVHCVIIGFSCAPRQKEKVIFTDNLQTVAKNINAYLLDAPDVFIPSRNKPICDVPKMTTGNRPSDGGHLIIEDSDYSDFITKEPGAKQYIKRLIGSEEFIKNKKRWCLWLVGVSPTTIKNMPLVYDRVKKCMEARLNSPDKGRQKLAEKPSLFRETNNPDTFCVIPKVSSEQRKYIPIGFLTGDTIATDLVMIVSDVSLYMFGVLTSNVHMAWMRVVTGRLKSDYRYSTDIVYNNFPWPEPTQEQKTRIEQTAQGILDARDLYPNSSLAALYDNVAMPIELRKAHQANDRAVMQAYGLPVKDTTESDCVAFLMKKYSELTKQ